MLDHNINIQQRIKESNNNNARMFDVLDDSELDMVLESCYNLLELYNIDTFDEVM